MSQYGELLKAALSVLTALINRLEPDLNDIDQLRRFAPDCADYHDDDLACEVVQRAIANRAKARVQ